MSDPNVYYLASREFPCARITVFRKGKRTARVLTTSLLGLPEYVPSAHLFDTPEKAASLTMTMLLAQHLQLMKKAEAIEDQMDKVIKACVAERARGVA